VRVERQHLGVGADDAARLGDRRRGQRADPAQVLGQDEIRCRGGERGPVQLVERQVAGGPLAHPGVDLGGGEVARDRRVDDHRARRADGGRALERHGDEPVGEAQSHDDLGRGRQQ